jgi:hypothetical protein
MRESPRGLLGVGWNGYPAVRLRLDFSATLEMTKSGGELLE